MIPGLQDIFRLLVVIKSLVALSIYPELGHVYLRCRLGYSRVETLYERVETFLNSLSGAGNKSVLAQMVKVRIGVTFWFFRRTGGVCGRNQAFLDETLPQGLSFLIELEEALIGELTVFLS